MPFSIIGATRWFPRTPCSYDQREGSGEPPSGFVDAERQCGPTEVWSTIFLCPVMPTAEHRYHHTNISMQTERVSRVCINRSNGTLYQGGYKCTGEVKCLFLAILIKIPQH